MTTSTVASGRPVAADAAGAGTAPNSQARRTFLRRGAALGGGLVIGVYLPARWSAVAPAQAAVDATANVGMPAKASTAPMPNAFVRIAPDNTITLICARSEMGQDAYTSTSMLIAEELEVDLNTVLVEIAPPGEPYINQMLGGQLTGGSTSVRDAYDRLRLAGASARMMLVQAAAAKWGIDPAGCTAANAVITAPDGRKVTYGEVADAASKLTPPRDVPLKPRSAFRVISNPEQKRLDTPAKVRGTAVFGIDAQMPGMKYAAVRMSPVLGGTVAGVDDSAAMKIPGVNKVVRYSRGVAVVADSYWQAQKGADALNVDWNPGRNATLSTASIRAGLADAAKKTGASFRTTGDVAAALKGGAQRYEATYETPFVSHAPLEPMNTTAHVTADKAVLITPTQFQQLAPVLVGEAIGLKPDQVEVHTTFLGGGFGRRIDVDYAVDAAEISKAAGGIPVKMIWSREEDMTHDFYRPATRMTMAAATDAAGKPVAFRFHSTAPSVTARLFPEFVKDGLDPYSVEAIANFAYAIPNVNLSYQLHDTGVPVGYWRSVSHNANAFAVESFMDELAHGAKADPLAWRIANLDAENSDKDKVTGVTIGARMKNVLEAVRERSGWASPVGERRGRGVAVMEGYNSVIAVVAEVAVDEAMKVALEKVTAVVDAGPLIHPDQALAQIQSCINDGQTCALFAEITIANGQVEQRNFDRFRLTRINEAPKSIDITFLPARPDQPPGGLGEPTAAVMVPAIANAVFAATGKRVRKLPITPEALRTA